MVFGYGGIGVVLHSTVDIGPGVVIGAGVTLGGGAARGAFWVDDSGERIFAPRVKENSYIATGAKILGGIEIGALSIVGANSVVISNVPPLSVVAGVPAKIINRITVENCARYKSTFYPLRNIDNDRFREMVSRCTIPESDSRS